MSDRLKQIIKGAIKEEKHFMEFYRGAAQKTKTPSARDLLIRLSLQEKSHKDRLEALDIRSLSKTLLPGALDSMSSEEVLMLTPISEFKELKGVFGFAIKAEKTAQKMYLRLMRSVDDKAAKTLFGVLAKEEKDHEALLKAELKKLGI